MSLIWIQTILMIDETAALSWTVSLSNAIENIAVSTSIRFVGVKNNFFQRLIHQ
jgi:hypothetical protein